MGLLVIFAVFDCQVVFETINKVGLWNIRLGRR
jgi:hypothetical protein